MYAQVENGVPVSTRSRPNWRNDDGSPVSDTVLIANGYYPVVDSPPSYDKNRQTLTKLPPKDWTVFDDRVEITYNIVDKSLNTVKEERRKEIESKYNNILSNGFSYDFGTKNATLEDGTAEQAGIRTLQTQSKDRERWSTTNQIAQQYIVAGQPTEPMRPFRTKDNARIPMTAKEANDCLNAMQGYFGLAMENMWDHKDSINTKQTVVDVVNYDITTNWP